MLQEKRKRLIEMRDLSSSCYWRSRQGKSDRRSTRAHTDLAPEQTIHSHSVPLGFDSADGLPRLTFSCRVSSPAEMGNLLFPLCLIMAELDKNGAYGSVQGAVLEPLREEGIKTGGVRLLR